MSKSKVLAILAAAATVFSVQTASASPFSVFGGSWNDAFKRVFQNAKNYSGSSYVGELDSSGRYSGEGAEKLQDGTTYWGSFIGNDFSGTFSIYIIGDPDQYRVKNCPDCKYYVGDFSKGIKSGTGTCYDGNGKLIYYGDFQNDKPTGKYPTTSADLVDPYTWGNIDNRDGTRYVGELKYGKKHGQGIMLIDYGEYAAWFGTFDEGEPTGYGVWFTVDGDSFSGKFDEVDLSSPTDGVLTGAVIDAFDRALSHPNITIDGGRYLGNRTASMADGLGLFRFDEKKEYVFGDYTDNKRDGMCIYIITDSESYFTNCPDSRYFVGYYSNNVKDGYGTMYDKDGNLLYYGMFADGKPTETYPSSGYDKYKFELIQFEGGDMYLGETENGDPHGRGIYIYSNKDLGVWYGKYSNGKADGEGVLIGYDGTVINGEFDSDGKFHESSTLSPSDPYYSSGTLQNTEASKTFYENPLFKNMISKMFATTTKTFSNSGDKYKGMMDSEGYMTGLGAYLWNAGSMYWGYQDKGSSEQYGMYIAREGYEISNCPEGAVYVGEYEGDKRHGKGTIYSETGILLYYGNFVDGEPVDRYPSTEDYLTSFLFEVIDCGNYVYFGETMDGVRHGYGFIIFKNNGDAWYGEWQNGHRQGKGVYIYADGSTDYGSWNGDDFTRLSLSSGGYMI